MDFSAGMKRRILLFDGAMGTLLLSEGILKPGECTELLNLNRPMDVLDAHTAYFQAGADILTANTFGANSLRLQQFGLASRMEEIVQSGVTLCREAAAAQARIAYVAASIGPTGLSCASDRSMPARMYESFFLQCAAAAAAGADLILIETMYDLCEARLALLAARAATHLPVLVSFTLEMDAHTHTGSPPDVLALCCYRLGASMIGVNCGYGPSELLPGFSQMTDANFLPAFAMPNSGLPENGVYRITPQNMAHAMEPYLLRGARAIGSCCGTTPLHTQALSELLRAHQPLPARFEQPGAYICSMAKRLPLQALCTCSPIPLSGLPFDEAVARIKHEAQIQPVLHIDFADYPPEDIANLIFTILPYVHGTPLVFHLYTATQASAALFAYPGIAGVYVHGDAYGVLKATARFGAEVIH